MKLLKYIAELLLDPSYNLNDITINVDEQPMELLLTEIEDMIVSDDGQPFAIVISSNWVHKVPIRPGGNLRARRRRVTDMFLVRVSEDFDTDAVQIKSWKNLDRRYSGPNSGYGKALRAARNMREKLNFVESVLRRFCLVAAEETGMVDNTPVPILCDRLNDMGYPEVAVILANYEKQLGITADPPGRRVKI